ncbi:hypothetical protein BD626DRAFT_473063 [Schizophyllum amplum]|uniref:Uncharacterized protein n=1 Tax=Schizophyllum amplum TaxID=97359 RepID=A0A550CWH3_9AGAR|nr:hypothetical protein BD626DRAFT_473063 [Auriculariopsis ampla]
MRRKTVSDARQYMHTAHSEHNTEVLPGQIQPQVEAGREPPKETPPSREEDKYYEDGGPWYMGKAREDFRRRKSGQPRDPREDEDPIQWARDRRNAEQERRNAEQERESDFGPEDYFDGAMRQRGDVLPDEEFQDTLLLLALIAAISALVWLRMRLANRVRQRENGGREDDRDRLGNMWLFDVLNWGL